jgi:hypothetical protein
MPNPVTVNLPAMDDIKDRTKNIVAVSRFNDPLKGLTELLKAFAIALECFPTTQLAVVGPYNLDDLVPGGWEYGQLTYKKLICDLKIPTQNLHFTGWIKDVEPYYRDACVHVLPSRYEGFGLTITEAAAFGLPSVIFDGSGSEDIIEDGIDGFIVPQGDVEAMADRICLLISDEQKLKEMSLATKNIVKRHDIAVISEKWRVLIDSMLTLGEKELHHLLQDQFMMPVKDKDAFIKQVVLEYEACVIKLSRFMQTKLIEAQTQLEQTQGKLEQTRNEFEIQREQTRNELADAMRIVNHPLVARQRKVWHLIQHVRRAIKFFLRSKCV